MCIYVLKCHGTCVEVRRQLVWTSFLHHVGPRGQIQVGRLGTSTLASWTILLPLLFNFKLNIYIYWLEWNWAVVISFSFNRIIISRVVGFFWTLRHPPPSSREMSMPFKISHPLWLTLVCHKRGFCCCFVLVEDSQTLLRVFGDFEENSLRINQDCDWELKSYAGMLISSVAADTVFHL